MILFINTAITMYSVPIELSIVLRSTCKRQYPNTMPFTLIKLSFKFLPLVVLQLVKVLKYFRINICIFFKLRVVENSSSLILIILPFALIYQHIVPYKPLSIAISLVLLEFSLVDFSVRECKCAKAMETVALLFTDVFNAVVIDLLNSIKHQCFQILILKLFIQ